MSNIGKLVNYFKLSRQAWQPREVLLRQQLIDLNRMIDYARTTIPYYRERYRSLDLDNKPIRSIADLTRLPIITKQDIQVDPEKILAPGTDLSKCLEMHTSGSTGMPLKIYYGSRDDDYSKINNLRSFVELGYRPWHRFVTISDPEWVERRYQGNKMPLLMRLGIFRPIDISLRERAEVLVDQLLSFGCDVLYGYPSNIFLVAKEIERRGIASIRPKLVVANGELLEDEMRAYINKVFQTTMVDFYTTEEFKRIAWECHSHAGYHIDVNSVVVELISKGEPVPAGERGEIIITGLQKFTMPLIRYRMGDVGIISERSCPCGRGLPLLEKIEGRRDNFIVNQDNQTFSPLIFWSILRHRHAIQRYRVHQKSKDLIVFQYVPSSSFHEGTVGELREIFLKTLGSGMTIQFEKVNDISYDKRGSVYSDIKVDLYK